MEKQKLQKSKMMENVLVVAARKELTKMAPKKLNHHISYNSSLAELMKPLDPEELMFKHKLSKGGK